MAAIDIPLKLDASSGDICRSQNQTASVTPIALDRAKRRIAECFLVELNAQKGRAKRATWSSSGSGISNVRRDGARRLESLAVLRLHWFAQPSAINGSCPRRREHANLRNGFSLLLIHQLQAALFSCKRLLARYHLSTSGEPACDQLRCVPMLPTLY
jgi:hypothetical protein